MRRARARHAALVLVLASSLAGCPLVVEQRVVPVWPGPDDDTVSDALDGGATPKDAGVGGVDSDGSALQPSADVVIATDAMPNRNPTRFPPIQGQLLVGNATGEPRVVRVRMLRPTIGMDCAAVESAPSVALRDEHFATAQSWLLPPGRNLAVGSAGACGAALVEASGVQAARLLFWSAAKWPSLSLPSTVVGAQGLGGFAARLLTIEAVEGKAAWSKQAAAFDPPTGVDPVAPPGCKLPNAEADLIFAELPTGDFTLVDLLSAPDGCHRLTLFGGGGAKDAYLCVPDATLPLQTGDDVFIAKLASGHNILPLDGVEIVAGSGHIRAGRGEDLVYFGKGTAEITTTNCPAQHDAFGTWARALQVNVMLPGATSPLTLAPGQTVALGKGQTLTMLHAEQRLLWDSAKVTSVPNNRHVESAWIQQGGQP